MARYGPYVLGSLLGADMSLIRVSPWWRDVYILGYKLGKLTDWFVTPIRKVVGNGLHTRL